MKTLKFMKLSSKQIYKYIKFNFSGCENHSCGCKSSNENKSEKDEIETKLKATNYKIIQCINLGKFEDALELSNEYIKEILLNYGKI